MPVEHHDLTALLQRVQRQELDVQSAAAALIGDFRPRTAPAEGAAVDVDRSRRCGFPEVVYCAGKTPDQVVSIFATLLEHEGNAFGTRADDSHAAAVKQRWPRAEYNTVGRTLRIGTNPACDGARVTVVSAGTSDLPVAEEARETALWMGVTVDLIVDVGVAGPHRLPERIAEIRGSDAVVVVAGMEGALASVIGGWLDCPVIAVPTSVGYGAHLGGITPLLGMLNSCTANVTAVNIDAGFKGGYVAGLIATRAHASRPQAS